MWLVIDKNLFPLNPSSHFYQSQFITKQIIATNYTKLCVLSITPFLILSFYWLESKRTENCWKTSFCQKTSLFDNHASKDTSTTFFFFFNGIQALLSLSREHPNHVIFITYASAIWFKTHVIFFFFFFTGSCDHVNS